ncbi:MAG: lytic transglycosylase domain-containing protein [Clostridioides sp.]|jgi:soluble lytic murein transglycosylase|nr:lytic transglycosylase domain-containing protein [Clostridioides sp.]
MSKKRFLLALMVVALLGAVLYESEFVRKIIYPKKYSEYVSKYSKEYGLDENFVYSIIKVESKFNEKAVSKRQAKGLMQIMDVTKEWATKEMKISNEDIFDPETNIKIGCWYLKKLFNEFDDKSLVIAAYNGGSGNVNKWLKNKEYSTDGKTLQKIPFSETSKYLDKVNKAYKIYNEIYGVERN